MSPDILLVEDNRAVALSYRMALESFGFAVEVVADSVAALERIGAHRFAMVLSDCHLPLFEAPELLRKARELDPSLPMVCISVEVDDELRRRCKEAGADLVLSKPVDYEYLGFLCRGSLRHTLACSSGLNTASFRRLDEMVADLRSRPRVPLALAVKELSSQLGLERLFSASGALESLLSRGRPRADDIHELGGWLGRELELLWDLGLVR